MSPQPTTRRNARRRQHTPRRRAAYRPELSPLEDRCLLAVVRPTHLATGISATEVWMTHMMRFAERDLAQPDRHRGGLGAGLVGRVHIDASSDTILDFYGTDPALPGSTASLSLDLTTDQFLWSSDDSELGSVSSGGNDSFATANEWNQTQAGPAKVTFDALSAGVNYLGSALVNATQNALDRAVIAVGELGKQVEYILAKVSITSMSASLPSTKNPATGARPGAGEFKEANDALTFTPAAANDLMVEIQNAGDLTVKVAGKAPANFPISWTIRRNPADSVAAAGVLPALSAKTGDMITVTPNTPGNFQLIAYYDRFKSGIFIPGEELKVLPMAIVSATTQFKVVGGNETLSYIKAAPTFTASLRAAGPPQLNRVSTGTLDNPAMFLQATILLQGGGANELVGITKPAGGTYITMADIGNLTGDSFLINYPVPAPAPPAPGNVPGTEEEHPNGQLAKAQPYPLVDAGPKQPPYRSQSTGTPGNPAATAAGAGGKGQVWTVTGKDAPAFDWSQIHVTTKNPWKTTQGSNDFTEFVAASTSTFARNYFAVDSGTWTISCVGNDTGAGAKNKWKDTGSAATVQGGKALAALTAINTTGDAANLQVFNPSFVVTTANVDYPPAGGVIAF